MQEALWAIILGVVLSTAKAADLFIPLSYKVNLNFQNSLQDRNFDGSAEIRLGAQNLTGIKTIVLDWDGLSTTVNSISVSDGSISLISSYNSEKKLYINVDIKPRNGNLNEFIIYTLQCQFKGRLRSVGESGIFLSDEMDFIGSQPYPDGLPKMLPCIFSPAYTAIFDLTVVSVPNRFVLNYPYQQQTVNYTIWGLGFFMSKMDYLRALTIGHKRQLVFGNKMKETEISNNDEFVSYIDNAEKKRIFLVPHLNVPFIAFCELVIIDEDIITCKAKGACGPEQSKRSMLFTRMAFESANLRCDKTLESWNDVWLVESLPLYLSYYYIQVKSSALDYLTLLDMKMPSLQQEATVYPSWKDDEIIEALSTGKYVASNCKAASILLMLEIMKNTGSHHVSDDIENYIKNNEHLSTESLIKELQTTSQMSNFLSNWLNTADYPTLEINQKQNQIDFHQASSLTKKDFTWTLPIQIEYENKTAKYETVFFMQLREKTINVDPTFNMTINSDQLGYYRTAYDLPDDNSRRDLVNSFNDKSLASWLDDTYFKAKHAQTEDAMIQLITTWDMIQNAGKNYSLTWAVISKQFNELYTFFYQSISPDYMFKDKFSNILYRPYSEIDQGKSLSDLSELLTRKIVVETSCKFSVSSCRNDVKVSAPELAGIKLCYDLIDVTTVEEWSEYFKKYNEDDNKEMRDDILKALACPSAANKTGSPVIKMYLDKIAGGDILREDLVDAFGAITSQPQHIDQAIYYLSTRYINIQKKWGESAVVSILKGTASRLTSSYHKELLEYMKTLSDATNSTQLSSTINDVLKTLASNMEFIGRNENAVRYWMGLSPATVTTTTNNTPSSTSDTTGNTTTTTGKPSSSHMPVSSTLSLCLAFLLLLISL